MGRTAAEEAREQAIDFWVVVGVEAALLVVIALVLWPLGRLSLALSLAKGFGLFFPAVMVLAAALGFVQRKLRVNLYDHADAFLLSNAFVSGLLVTGWSAFAALSVRAALAGAPVWLAAALFMVGLLAVHMGYGVVSAFYNGTFYRYTNLAIAAAAFVLFSFWPAAASFLFAWFFGLF